jgi:hypothetical protein
MANGQFSTLALGATFGGPDAASEDLAQLLCFLEHGQNPVRLQQARSKTEPSQNADSFNSLKTMPILWMKSSGDSAPRASS